MEIHITLTKEERKRIKDWALEAGYTMPRAYTELIRKGMKHENI
jgi:hypothetical protein